MPQSGRMEIKMFKDLVIKNRSTRSFVGDYEISRNELLELIDTARITPSAMNKQPLLYIPVGKEHAPKVLANIKMAASLGIKLPPEGCEPSAYILVCVKKDSPAISAYTDFDVGIATQTILLAAVEKGISGCIIGSHNTENILREFGLDDDIDIRLCIVLGKAAENIILEDTIDGGLRYYRDAENNHHVPKRKLSDIVIEIK